jgi:adenine-specific DNA-methyltransferase
LSQSTDAWVFEYERITAAQAREERRKGGTQQGVFYTPPNVARYLVRQSLGQRLESLLAWVESADSASRPAIAVGIWAKVQAMRLLDPSCGTGIFLVEALRTLVAFYRRLTRWMPEPTSEQDDRTIQPARYVVLHQLYGMDIDPLSVAIAEARLAQWVRNLDGSAEPESESPVNSALDCTWAVAPSHWYEGDTLSAPDGLFPEVPNWMFILGNPPYVSEVRRQATRFRALQGTAASPYYRAKMDLCDAFLAWGAAHTQPGGQLAYVLPEYWTQRAGAAPVRETLWSQGRIREFRIFPETPLFPDAPGHHSSLLVWERHEETRVEKAGRAIRMSDSYTADFAAEGDATDLQAKSLRPARFWLYPASGKLLYGEPAAIGLLERISRFPPLLAAESISQGIVIPQGRARPDGRRARGLPGKRSGSSGPREGEKEPAEKERRENGIFLLTRDELETLNLSREESALMKPYYTPGRFKAFEGFNGFQALPPDYDLIYGDADNRRRMREEPAVYARLRAHLERFSEINTSDFAPYGLHRPRRASCFEGGARILGLRQTAAPCFAVVEGAAYVNESFYIIRSGMDPWCAVALLNSDLAHFWFYYQKRKGHRLQIDKDVLAFFPAPPEMTESLSADLTELSRRLARINSVMPASAVHHAWNEGRQALNMLVNAAYGLSVADGAIVKRPSLERGHFAC